MEFNYNDPIFLDRVEKSIDHRIANSVRILRKMIRRFMEAKAFLTDKIEEAHAWSNTKQELEDEEEAVHVKAIAEAADKLDYKAIEKSLGLLRRHNHQEYHLRV